MATHSSVLAWMVSMDKGAWWATVHGLTESDKTGQLSAFSFYYDLACSNCTDWGFLCFTIIFYSY